MTLYNISLNDFVFNKQITQYLMILKIPPRLDGYEFIKCGVKKICFNPSNKCNVNNVLYPAIAHDFNVSKLIIDRSIRHAIKVSCQRGGIIDIEKYSKKEFKNSCPSPKELLCMLAELVKIEKDKFVKQLKSTYPNFLANYIENPVQKYRSYLKNENKKESDNN